MVLRTGYGLPLLLVLGHVTLRNFVKIRIEVSPLTLALIGRPLIYIQAATFLLADDRVGVGVPKKALQGHFLKLKFAHEEHM